jgi:hypothetical protein
LTAVDKEWYSNRASLNVTIIKSDTVAPFILKDKIYVTQEWEKYRVVLVLNDDLSGVEGWTISQDWKTLKTFSKNYAEFLVTNPWIVNVTAKDSYWNELNDTIDITSYIPWYNKPSEESTQVQNEPEETPESDNQ